MDVDDDDDDGDDDVVVIVDDDPSKQAERMDDARLALPRAD